MFTLYHADCVGHEENCLYPHKVEVKDAKSLAQAVSHDYVCAKYKNSYRSNKNMEESDCVAVEFDNVHSNDPEEWVTPEKLRAELPNVEMGIHYSRNHMKTKKGRSPRPKFHAMLRINQVTNPDAYKKLKEMIAARIAYVDTNAIDSARFFYGTENPQVEYYSGKKALDDFFEEEEFDAHIPSRFSIPEGSRNSTMSRFAGRVVKRFGWNDGAHQLFLDEAQKCDPPLEDSELAKIWNSARKFEKVVSAEEGYIPPDKYNAGQAYDGPAGSLKPEDYSDNASQIGSIGAFAIIGILFVFVAGEALIYVSCGLVESNVSGKDGEPTIISFLIMATTFFGTFVGVIYKSYFPSWTYVFRVFTLLTLAWILTAFVHWIRTCIRFKENFGRNFLSNVIYFTIGFVPILLIAILGRSDCTTIHATVVFLVVFISYVFAAIICLYLYKKKDGIITNGNVQFLFIPYILMSIAPLAKQAVMNIPSETVTYVLDILGNSGMVDGLNSISQKSSAMFASVLSPLFNMIVSLILRIFDTSIEQFTVSPAIGIILGLAIIHLAAAIGTTLYFKLNR